MPKLDSASDSPTAWILFALALGVFAMALIGAITRLTESGLSIMEWAPVAGVLPPLSLADWQSAYDLYAQSGEFRAQPAPPTLAEFRAIFWWEWAHRQFGRLLGLALVSAIVWFWYSGRLTARRARAPDKGLAWLVFVLALLGVFQATVGWWMVASGFSDRTDVAPLRLAFHLTLALVIYALLIRSALHRAVWHSGFARALNTPYKRQLLFLWRVYLVLLFLLIVSGALVAGSNAGFIYNTWPLMDGDFVPIDYTAPAAPSWFGNATEHPSAIQFHHRWFALAMVLLTFLATAQTYRVLRNARPAVSVLIYIFAPAVMVCLQFLLGITTLVLAVPIWLGVLHQAGALLLLTATLFLLSLLTKTEAKTGAGDGNRTHDT